MKKNKWDRKNIFPANGGLLLFVNAEYNPGAFDKPHLEARVVRTGNGVPWLKTGSRVIVPTAKITGFTTAMSEVRSLLEIDDEHAARIGEYVELQMVHQQDILAVIEY